MGRRGLLTTACMNHGACRRIGRRSCRRRPVNWTRPRQCLAGCGQTETDRTTGGAATGASTGAAIGLVGGPVGVVAGALIGGGVGAVSGATVPEKHLDLGAPPWSDAPPQVEASQTR
jgi:hypothetical protein